MKRKALDIFFGDSRVSGIVVSETERMEFSYDPAWNANASAIPLSVSLPLQGTFLKGRG